MSFLHDWQPELRLEPSWFLVRIFSWIALSGVCLLFYASWYQVWFLLLLLPWYVQLKYWFWPSIRLKQPHSVQAVCLQQGEWQLTLCNGVKIQARLEKVFCVYGMVILTFQPSAQGKLSVFEKLRQLFWVHPIRVMILSDQLADKELRFLRSCLRFRRKDFFVKMKPPLEF